MRIGCGGGIRKEGGNLGERTKQKKDGEKVKEERGEDEGREQMTLWM